MKLRTLAFLVLFALAPLFAHAGTATVTCTPPTTNVDGSALTNLAGFRFYYGTDQNSLTQFVQVANPATCSNTFANLADGQWYFAVTAYTASGAESVDSTIVSKTLATTPPLTPTGVYAYEATGTTMAPTMSAVGLLLPGVSCGSVVRQIGTTKFCQIARAQADLIGWPVDKALANGVWAKAQ